MDLIKALSLISSIANIKFLLLYIFLYYWMVATNCAVTAV